MSDLSDSNYKEPRSAPTVTRDKWIAHACSKMAKGYSLIISPGKKSARFFKRGKGYDPCPFMTAKRLLEMKLIQEDGTHPLGTVYTLIPEALTKPPPRPAAEPDPDDEDEEADESLIEALETLEAEGGIEVDDEDEQEEDAPDEHDRD